MADRQVESISRRRWLRLAMAASGSLGCLRGSAGEAGNAEPAIDCHVHVWTADDRRYPLRAGFEKAKMALPSFTPQELFTHCRPCGVTRVVLIQMSYYAADNAYMLDVIRDHPGVFAGIARIDEDPRPGQVMKSLASRGVRGLRIAPAGRRPDDWLAGPGAAETWRYAAEMGMVLCPLIDPEYLDSLGAMCARFPATRVAIDHMARIGARGPVRVEDVDRLCRLARHKNVYVKVSAFYALGLRRRPYLDLAPLVRRLYDAFGPQRLAWGSDSPFAVLPPHVYRDSIELVRSKLDFLSASDRAWLIRKTSEKLFF